MSLEQALAELDNSNELRAFCDRHTAVQLLEELAIALSGDSSNPIDQCPKNFPSGSSCC